MHEDFTTTREAPSLSVVIPTKDRLDILRRQLELMTAQDLGRPQYEVIVVDNGSADGTLEAARAWRDRLDINLALLHEPKRGPAAARNRGAEEARGPVLLFLGDDMLPAGAGLLRGHLELHTARPEREYAAVGHVEWHPHNPITPFMAWLDGGQQFAFGRFPTGRVPAWRAFYTSQVSLKRELFDAVGGFDERFPYASVEDIELGVRLDQAGIHLDYRPELVVQHDHPTDVRRWMRRSRITGESAAIYNNMHPDRPLVSFPVPRGLEWRLFQASFWWLSPLARLERLPARYRHVVWRRAQRAGYAAGYYAKLRAVKGGGS